MKQIHHAINNCKKNDPKHKNSRSIAHTHTSFIDTELFFDLSTVFRIEIKFISREMRKKSSHLFPTSRISVIATQQKFLAEEFCVFFLPDLFVFVVVFFSVHFAVVCRGYVITNIIGQKFYHFFIRRKKL